MVVANWIVLPSRGRPPFRAGSLFAKVLLGFDVMNAEA
jgi:hypothetical protein